ncbi:MULTISPECIES: SIS domain-containing protein [Bacillaceae]|uniref:SIS domain-containing protein n=1 Tax=Bacillaceae TaxID=186817 RepID=UPI0008E36D7B|nr:MULTISPECIES: SIS domain-containing protein [Bacillaceae]MCZ8540298.1 SIS domain-containing protein [Psychrobacillus psychrodurans]SFM61018.1 fructoselysine-6-phosphate deglycase [Psychrobacillus psychrodurans]
MLKYDEELFLRLVEEEGLAYREQIENFVDEICKKGYSNIFLIGAGGTIAMMYPYEYILKSNSTIEVQAEIAAEFMVMNNKRFSKDSVCIFTSVSGTTEETVAAAKLCKERGATTIALVAEPNTPLTQVVDYCITTGSETHSFDTFFMLLYMVVFRFMYNNNEFPQYEQFTNEVALLPKAILNSVKAFDAKAEEFASKHKDTDYHMMVGSGNLWGNTYSYAMCILEEMQWIHAKSIHAAEFFHGTLELVVEDTSVILLKGEDETRPLMDRVERFAEKITKQLTVIDTKDFEMEGISEEFRKHFSVSINWALLSRISVHLERERNHPLTLRRYYRQMAY